MIKSTKARARIHNQSKRKFIRLNIRVNHLTEQSQRLMEAHILYITSDHRIPSDDISVGNFIKHLLGNPIFSELCKIINN
uniref:Uncharacterized protein n=1 Tax=Rhizophora mucronata TaxID=61149 RepID=A0A2P2NMN9_RHIMU